MQAPYWDRSPKAIQDFFYFLPYSPQKCVATEKSHPVCFDVNVLTSSLLTLAHRVRSCCKESTTFWKALHVLCFAARKPPASLTSRMLPITLNNSGFLRSRSIIRNRHPNLTSLINNIIPFCLDYHSLLHLLFMNFTKAAEKQAYAAHCHQTQRPLQQNSDPACLKQRTLNAKQNQYSMEKTDWWFITFIHKTIYIHLCFAMRQISLLFGRSLLSVAFSLHLQIGRHFPWADRKRKIAFLLLVSSY